MIGRVITRLASRNAGLLAMILLGALSVRLLGVGRGLPYIHEYSEPTILNYVIGMLQRGDLNPGAFVYPSVYYYMLLPAAYLHYFYLHARGVLTSPLAIQSAHPQAVAYWWYLNPASFYLWGRTLTVLIGTATVYLVYRIGSRVYGTTAGLLAAAFLALAPGAVYYADSVHLDIPMAFFATLTVLAGLGVVERGGRREYLLAGLCAGIAISTRSNAIVLLVPLAAAHLVNRQRPRNAHLRLIAMGLAVLAGIVAGTPYLAVEPKIVIDQLRSATLSHAGVPDVHLMRRSLTTYLRYLAVPATDVWYGVPHTAFGMLPLLAAAVGIVTGFRTHRRLHLYLLSFPLVYLLFMSGQHALELAFMMAVLPFVALFAAAGCVWAWRRLQRTRWPAATATWSRGLAGLALVALLAQPARDAIVLGWTIGHTPDTRSAAAQWLRLHVPPGTRVAVDPDLRWYLPDLDALPFPVLFPPRGATRDWYLREHADFAVVGDQGALRSLPPVVVFPWPASMYGRGEPHFTDDIHLVIDPTLSVVRPKVSEINSTFPVKIGAEDMIAEPVMTDAVGVYSETVRLPVQRFAPGTYIVAVAGDWPRRLWAATDVRLSKLVAKVRVGDTTVNKVTLKGTQPLGFATPVFRIDGSRALPVQIDLSFWTQQQATTRQNPVEWAFRPSAGGCATVPLRSRNQWRLDLQQMTLEAWVYLEGMDEPPGGMRPGLESEAPILNKGKHEGYYLRLVGDSNNRIFADLSVAGKFSVGRAGFVPFRKWTHIAATYDRHEARIYLNGLPAAPDRNPVYAGTVHAKDYPLIVGCRDPGQPDQAVFKGLITGVRIWNRVLTADDIRREAGPHQLPDAAGGLVGSWSFQSLVNGAILDMSGETNDLDAKSLQSIPADVGSPVRPAWTSTQVNPLRTVTIERTAP